MSPSSYCFFRSKSLNLAALGCLALSWGVASATPVTYSGVDLNAGPGDPHPNATAAATAFALASAALGVVSTITFENAPVGAFSSLTVAPGVTISGSDFVGNNQMVQSSPSIPSDPSVGGFNTTPGGANYVNLAGGSLVFNFATPIDSFGAYIDGIQIPFYNDTVTFSDGTTQMFNIPGAGTSAEVGGLEFLGFTDAGKSFSSVTFYAGNANIGSDEIGVDDVQYGVAKPAAVTPEPESLVLVLTGLGGVGAVFRRFGRRRAV